MKKIYSGGNYSRISFTERKQLVENAVKSGLKSTINGCRDIVKRSFLYDIAGRHDEKFLKDVLVAYKNKYQYNGKYKGKGAKNIASKEYISYHEKNIFGNGLGSDFYKDYNYKNYIINHLTELVDPFMYDLQKVTNENDRKQFQAIIKDLEKCGVKMSATYYGNPNIPKPKKTKEYTFIIPKEKVKQIAKIYDIVNSAPMGIIESGISILLASVIPSFGIPAFIICQINQATRITQLDEIKEAAKQNKRVKVKCTTLQDENFKDIEMKHMKLYIIN